MTSTYNNATNFLEMGDRQDDDRIIGLRNLAKASAAQKMVKIELHCFTCSHKLHWIRIIDFSSLEKVLEVHVNGS